MFATTLGCLKTMDSQLKNKIVNHGLQLMKSANRAYNMPEKMHTIMVQDNVLFSLVSKVTQQLTWTIGRQAYELIKIEKVKEEEDEDEEEKKEEDEKDEKAAKKKKMEDRKKVVQMVVQSNVISGGIELDHIGILKPECIE